MSTNAFYSDDLNNPADSREIISEVRREAALLKAGALQSAIFNSANFSSIATDAKGVILAKLGNRPSGCCRNGLTGRGDDLS